MNFVNNVPKSRGTNRMSDSIASGMARLVSELEKRDPILREPLTCVTYHRDIPILVGGGWAQTLRATNVNYGVDGGTNSLSSSSGANEVKIVQANFSDTTWKTLVFRMNVRIGFIDLERGKYIGRSLEEIYETSVRLGYDKYLENNCYLGFEDKGTYGIINSPNVTTQLVTSGASGSSKWLSKTPDEILQDINQAITYVWSKAENDPSAVPNHIIIPYEQYSHIATAKVSEHADKTILTFLEENNISSKMGENLVIGATSFCKGSGTSGTDRMVVYVHDKKFLRMEELVPLYRGMTAPNVEQFAYDTAFTGNISQVEMFYEEETIGYFDGI